MKKLIYITLTLAFFYGMNPEVAAWVSIDANKTVVEEAQKGNYVFFRLDKSNMDAYLAFKGPAHKLGDNVDVKIYHGGTGALVQQEYFVAHGNSQREQFSINGLEPGPYSIVVTSDRYNLSQPFILD